MTYTIDLDATEERVLAQAAAARGVDVGDYLRDAWREMAALDAKEDADDSADARRALAESGSDDVVSWESLKAEMDGKRAA